MVRDSGGVLFTHFFEYLGIAASARDAARAAVKEDPSKWPSETIVAILMSALATEAFINELGPLMSLEVKDWDDGLLPQKPLLMNMSALLEEAEKGRAPVTFRYQVAAMALTGRTLPISNNPFQDFNDLLTLRNLLVHLRPGDMIDEQGNVVPTAKVIKNFQQRGLTHRRPATGQRTRLGMSWLNDLETDRMATWAYATAWGIIAEVVGMLPMTLPSLSAVVWLHNGVAGAEP